MAGWRPLQVAVFALLLLLLLLLVLLVLLLVLLVLVLVLVATESPLITPHHRTISKKLRHAPGGVGRPVKSGR